MVSDHKICISKNDIGLPTCKSVNIFMCVVFKIFKYLTSQKWGWNPVVSFGPWSAKKEECKPVIIGGPLAIFLGRKYRFGGDGSHIIPIVLLF